MRPRRIQRTRTKGWRMPEDAVYVGRPTRWGNPYPVGGMAVYSNGIDVKGVRIDHALAVAMYAALCREREWWAEIVRAELRGKDLVCYCALDMPCHADVLLAIAND